jgi:hypothetical protein
MKMHNETHWKLKKEKGGGSWVKKEYRWSEFD